ncbi:hypothetical protein CSB11_00785 [Candidatus Campbellbacteria bacterium]|nr:MAG: hypothetical protein CSB11_00785 [Candidatus Campbellbacteria bacterium]
MKKLFKSINVNDMNRDDFLIAYILSEVSDNQYKNQDFINIEIDGYPKEKIDYHIFLLKDAGFVTVAENKEKREMPVLLTWKGQEYFSSLHKGFFKWIEDLFS